MLDGKVFVITGALNHYENRNALKAEIESLGGKVAGVINSKTSYLLTNDKDSGTVKNRDARALGIPIISESNYMEMINKN